MIIVIWFYFFLLLLRQSDEFMRTAETDLDHHYEGLDLHQPNTLIQKYMNWICMKGLKYEVGRHIKRTWMHYTPQSSTDYTKVDPGDLLPEGESRDWISIVINGQRNRDELREYYTTKVSGKQCAFI